MLTSAYHVSVSGGLQLIPLDSAFDTLADNYAIMLADCTLLDADKPFERLIDHCADIEVRANTRETRACESNSAN